MLPCTGEGTPGPQLALLSPPELVTGAALLEEGAAGRIAP